MPEGDATARGGKHVRMQMELKRTLMLDLTGRVSLCLGGHLLCNRSAKQDLRRNSAPAAIWAPKQLTTILLATMRAGPDSVHVGA